MSKASPGWSISTLRPPALPPAASAGKRNALSGPARAWPRACSAIRAATPTISSSLDNAQIQFLRGPGRRSVPAALAAQPGAERHPDLLQQQQPDQQLPGCSCSSRPTAACSRMSPRSTACSDRSPSSTSISAAPPPPAATPAARRNVQDQLVTQLSGLMNVQVQQNPSGGVTVRTQDGMLLADTTAGTVGYQTSNTAPAYLTVSPASGGGQSLRRPMSPAARSAACCRRAIPASPA